jgi:N-methylhydantoinase A
VLVPRFPGITSGLGCVLAPVRHDFVQSVGQPLADAVTAEIDGRFADQAATGRRLLDQDGVPLAEIVVRHEVDLLFRGQSHVFRAPVTAPGFDSWVVLADFLERYKARFDIELPEMTAMLANLRTTIIGRRSPVDLAIFAPPLMAREQRGRVARGRCASTAAGSTPGSSTGLLSAAARGSPGLRSWSSRIRRWSSTPAQPPSSTAWAIW